MSLQHPHRSKSVPWYSVHMDAIRALAALTVFLSHVRAIFLMNSFRGALKGDSHGILTKESAVHSSTGHQAVIVFFVLSGFLVGGSAIRSMQKQRWSWKHYLVRRVTRLWMVLIPALLIGFCIDYAGYHHFTNVEGIYRGPAGQTEVLPHLDQRLTFGTLVGNAAFLQGILVPSLGTNNPLWSLSYEFWYYISFPLLLFVVFSGRAFRTRVVSLVVLTCLLYFAGSKIASYFLIWLLGAVVFLLPRRLPRVVLAAYNATALVLCLAVNVAVLRHTANLFLSDSLTALAFCFVLYGILHYTSPSVPGVYRFAATSASNMSYSLYANHLPLLVLASALTMPSWSRWNFSMNSAIRVSCVIGITSAICWLSYRCFEANTGRLRDFLLNEPIGNGSAPSIAVAESLQT